MSLPDTDTHTPKCPILTGFNGVFPSYDVPDEYNAKSSLFDNPQIGLTPDECTHACHSFYTEDGKLPCSTVVLSHREDGKNVCTLKTTAQYRKQTVPYKPDTPDICLYSTKPPVPRLPPGAPR
jgi:hypothetical protein